MEEERRLRKGDIVRIRRKGAGESGRRWTNAIVRMASEKGAEKGAPQSVALAFGEFLGTDSGGLYAGFVPLLVDYDQETVTDLNGNYFEMEIRP